MDLRPPMSFGTRFTQLNKEAAENAARLVLSQLYKRLHFSQRLSSNDEEMECLQFGICSYRTEPPKLL